MIFISTRLEKDKSFVMTNNTFFSLGLSSARLKIIKKLNFAIPTKIQAEAIPQILQGKDIMASSPTGSGKTAAYTLPLVDSNIC